MGKSIDTLHVSGFDPNSELTSEVTEVVDHAIGLGLYATGPVLYGAAPLPKKQREKWGKPQKNGESMGKTPEKW